MDVAYKDDRDKALADTAASAFLAAGPQQSNGSSTFSLVISGLGGQFKSNNLAVTSVISLVTFFSLLRCRTNAGTFVRSILVTLLFFQACTAKNNINLCFSLFSKKMIFHDES